MERNSNVFYHFGLSVGYNIGYAVVRNKVKRQLRSMIDQMTFQDHFNCIIIVRKGYLKNCFEVNQKNLFFALQQLDLVKGKKINETEK